MIDAAKKIWEVFFLEPILNFLVLFYTLTGNLGISIILFTITVRLLLLPLVIPSLRNMKKQRELQPELAKIKKKYKKDKKKQAEAQMALFKEHGMNPASGCITQLPMFVVLIAVYQVIRLITVAPDIAEINSHLYFDFLTITQDINTAFLWLDLGEKDPYYIIPIIAGVLQFFNSKLSMGFTKKAEKVAEKTPDKSDDLAYTVQQQMLYMMPVMTVIIAARLPSGVALYILTTTAISLVQTYFVFGGPKGKELLSKIK